MTQVSPAPAMYLVARDKSRYQEPEVHWCSLHNYNTTESVSERLGALKELRTDNSVLPHSLSR